MAELRVSNLSESRVYPALSHDVICPPGLGDRVGLTSVDAWPVLLHGCENLARDDRVWSVSAGETDEVGDGQGGVVGVVDGKTSSFRDGEKLAPGVT